MTVQEFARLGGKARARALSKKRLREIARKAGIASGKVRKLQAVAREFKAKEIASSIRASMLDAKNPNITKLSENKVENNS